jgi:hypothetical protein
MLAVQRNTKAHIQGRRRKEREKTYTVLEGAAVQRNWGLIGIGVDVLDHDPARARDQERVRAVVFACREAG